MAGPSHQPTAQVISGSNFVIVFFSHATTTCAGSEEWLHVFLSSPLDSGQFHVSAALTLGRLPVPSDLETESIPETARTRSVRVLNLSTR